jgi:hypothetical protein
MHAISQGRTAATGERAIRAVHYFFDAYRRHAWKPWSMCARRMQTFATCRPR